MGARRASTVAVTAVVGAALLVTLLVAWAAAIGPGEVLRGDGPTVEREADEPSEEASSSGTAEEEDPLSDLEERPPLQSNLFTLLGVTLQLLLIGGILYALALGARSARQSWAARARPSPPPDEVAFDVLDAPESLVRELAGGAAAQRDLLSSGTPRNAIVQVWNRFETLAGNAGATRRPWETSSEFTLKVLEAVDADSSAVSRLAALYREARFSDHELTEEHRTAAEAALATIHAGLSAAGRVDR